MSEKIEDLFNELTANINKIESRFINRYVKKELLKPILFELPVKAYCVLCYGVFEEYFESISLELMKKAIQQWETEKKISSVLLTLSSTSKHSISINNDDNSKIFDLTREYIDTLKKEFSAFVYHNHGASPKHIKKLLQRIGMELPGDSALLNSLNNLSNQRGEFAHKGISAKTILSPEIAKEYVDDGLLLAEKIKDSALLIK